MVNEAYQHVPACSDCGGSQREVVPAATASSPSQLGRRFASQIRSLSKSRHTTYPAPRRPRYWCGTVRGIEAATVGPAVSALEERGVPRAAMRCHMSPISNAPTNATCDCGYDTRQVAVVGRVAGGEMHMDRKEPGCLVLCCCRLQQRWVPNSPARTKGGMMQLSTCESRHNHGHGVMRCIVEP